MRELLFLEPVFKEAIWGGSLLQERYGYQIPSSHTGECWAISAHPKGDAAIASGTFQGKTLGWLWENHREWFTPKGQEPDPGEFPLLVKIIDAREDLSIQVHPDDAYAAAHENGALGKMECWYVLDCLPGTTIVIGHHARTRAELEEMIHDNRWKELIREIPVHKGDFFQINPGCVHAIKGGTLILETQQSSDITYRLYDYGRLSDGRPRPLHIRQSLDVIQVPFQENQEAKPRILRKDSQGSSTLLTACSRFTVEKLEIHGCWEENFPGSFTNISVLGGQGSLNGVALSLGQHLIVPADYGPCRFQGELFLICSQPGKVFESGK